MAIADASDSFLLLGLVLALIMNCRTTVTLYVHSSSMEYAMRRMHMVASSDFFGTLTILVMQFKDRFVFQKEFHPTGSG